MSRLRRTGRANLRTPHLATYVQYVYKMRSPTLHPPSTSSLGTAYFSTLLAQALDLALAARVILHDRFHLTGIQPLSRLD